MIQETTDHNFFSALKQIGSSQYWCDTNGNIWSHKWNKIKKLKARIHPEGYLQVALMIEGKRHEKLVHRLVAEAFINNTEKKPQINHKDGNKMNNQVKNLEWVTPSENGRHAYHTGLLTISYGEKNGRAKLTDDIVKSIFISKENTKDLATEYGVSGSTINKIRSGEIWKKTTQIKWHN